MGKVGRCVVGWDSALEIDHRAGREPVHQRGATAWSETEKPKTPPTWRDVIPVHPAANLLPPMSANELKALGEDLKLRGMTAPIVFWCEREADVGKTPAPKYELIDGRNRLDAMEMVGIKLIDFNGRDLVFHNMVWEEFRYGEGTPKMNAMTGNTTVERSDPYEYVLSANLNRRHLTNPQTAASARGTGSTIRNISTWWRYTSSAS